MSKAGVKNTGCNRVWGLGLVKIGDMEKIGKKLVFLLKILYKVRLGVQEGYINYQKEINH